MSNITTSIFNPAISLALPALTHRSADDIYIFLFGDMLGGCFAAGLFKFWHLNHESAEKIPQEVEAQYTKPNLKGSLITDDHYVTNMSL